MHGAFEHTQQNFPAIAVRRIIRRFGTFAEPPNGTEVSFDDVCVARTRVALVPTAYR